MWNYMDKQGNVTGKAIVVYSSKRGSTQQYAKWIAEQLSCDIVDFSNSTGKINLQKIDFDRYDCVIYGGWIRGSGIVDFDKFIKSAGENILSKLIVFGVGIAYQSAENYMQVWSLNIGKIDPQNTQKSTLYILDGSFFPDKIGGLDKFLMMIMKKVLISGSIKDEKNQLQTMKERIDKGFDGVKIENINSLVKEAKDRIM